MDQDELEQFMGAMTGHMTGAMLCFGIWLGDEVGLYRAMTGAGPMSAEEVAAAAGANPRLVREWLNGQAAGGLLSHDGGAGTYTLREVAALALADQESPMFVARNMASLASLFIDMAKIAEAFRGDGALPWGEHDTCLFSGTEWSFRTDYRDLLATEWIPAMDGVAAKLDAGATIADIGCGHGASTIALGEAYPESRITGFDLHAPSIRTAAKRAAEAGVADRVGFECATAKGYPGSYDLICFFNCLHDMGDPVGIAAYAREHLAPGGSLLLVEPFALDGQANITDNPMAAMRYHASAAICTPCSLSQEVGLGLGAQAGPARLAEILTEAGFIDIEVVASCPLNLIIQARP